MTKNENIAYTAGWVSHSYSITPPKYRQPNLQAAFDKGRAEREAMYQKKMTQVRTEMA